MSQEGSVPKQDIRLVAAGECEEVNTALGVVAAFGGFDNEASALLSSLQNDLFDLQADLGSAVAGEHPEVQVSEEYVQRLERAYAAYSDQLEPTDGAVLPGGTVSAALLFQARTVARRAERTAWAAAEAHTDSVNPMVARYLNRLSALLFVLARVSNIEHGDSIWWPGHSVAPAAAS